MIRHARKLYTELFKTIRARSTAFSFLSRKRRLKLFYFFLDKVFSHQHKHVLFFVRAPAFALDEIGVADVVENAAIALVREPKHAAFEVRQNLDNAKSRNRRATHSASTTLKK